MDVSCEHGVPIRYKTFLSVVITTIYRVHPSNGLQLGSEKVTRVIVAGIVFSEDDFLVKRFFGLFYAVFTLLPDVDTIKPCN